ncbi:MAG: fluoride efflux transporter CrcB [Bifidobacteriaceae bacterium]|jgi:CrcB protein|nr:fluoride efflux transporter CrcB [Bifidobacteriaceae bacterium]
MLNFLCVGCGAFVGACFRYFLTRVLPTSFPYGTLVSNVIAALFIGFVMGWERNITALAEPTRLLLTTGLLGGLSTFSAFSMETVTMLEAQEYLRAGTNVALNLGLCLVCVLGGLAAARLAH